MSRFIPAGAGNTRLSSVNFIIHPVYPRWRGEHIGGSVVMQARAGLSPLARGTHRLILLACYAGRFIPAGAGNTPMRLTPAVQSTVYPRWRGEHAARIKYVAAGCGLSPLARGTRRRMQPAYKRYRFIPAGAGNTDWRKQREAEGAVYPRWRGEHADGRHAGGKRIGLSPLARGTRI